MNNTTQYKDVNEILVKEGKSAVLNILQARDNPRFVEYYIQHTLKDITTLNLDSKVNDVLKVIRIENNAAHLDSYFRLISSLTKLSIADLNRVFGAIRPEYTSTQTTKSAKVIYPPSVNNMINSFRKLLTLLLIDPAQAEDSYSEFECKDPEKIKIQELQDYIYIVKTLATTTFAPDDLIKQENGLVDTIYKNRRIGQEAYSFMKDAIAEIQANRQASISTSNTKHKCVSIVEHINTCFAEVLLNQLKYDIANNKYSGQQLTQAQAEVTRLNNKINQYKRNKKTKYHIA
ncbi:MAG: hypothetical protein MJ219_01045 [Mycoplasmoidaceae bacterium]|nr:hypothetical protein [Mycoplasmoidaceae bacterium]